VVIRPERVAVWLLLSELYLDTEHDERALRWMARELARSPYGVPELREIELWEVAPVVLPNVCSAAGVWDGFDPGWLEAECRRRAAGRSLWLRLAALCGWRRLVRRTTAAYWARLEPLIHAERAGVPGPDG
jgi:hypothetical protein